MHSETETIVAQITAPGRGAIAVVRLSGSRAWEIAKVVFPAIPYGAQARFSYYGLFSHGDDGLAVLFAENASYTGEESAEFSIHGSPVSVRQLLENCVDAGARMAEPGEFTLRAFMNGRIDLAQAEGVRETIEAQSSRQLAYASSMRSGEVGEAVADVREELLAVLAAVEAQTDFSEEVGPLDVDGFLAHLSTATRGMDQLLASQAGVRVIRGGFSVALAGLPNAGKSSLLNAFLHQDRAIVTEIPGTTRDTIEESIEIDGVLVKLTDTAGVRETSDPLEKIGVERSRFALTHADLILYLYDSTAGLTDADRALFTTLERPYLLIATKSDLLASPIGENLAVSAKSGEGLQDLLQLIVERVSVQEDSLYLLDRHYSLLERSREATESARKTLSSSDLPCDLAAVEIQQALRLLGEITGETTPPDVIDQIFSRFCIGK